MNRDSINIAKFSLKILKNQLWKNLSLQELKKKSKIKNFDKLVKNKNDLLKKINNYFDYELNKLVKNVENSNNKDMLFEILMIRFDILQSNRNAIISIFDSFKKKPNEFIFFLPELLDSIILMVDYTKIPTKGLIGQLKIKGILIIYISTFLIWLKDDTIGLEKTMTNLDRYLTESSKLLRFIK